MDGDFHKRGESFTEEAAVLEEGRADLSPWRPNKEDPRAATAAKYAALLAAGLSTEEARPVCSG